MPCNIFLISAETRNKIEYSTYCVLEKCRLKLLKTTRRYHKKAAQTNPNSAGNLERPLDCVLIAIDYRGARTSDTLSFTSLLTLFVGMTCF